MISKCLLLVPHQDDETQLAGYTLNALHRAGVEIYVLYSTNGDWKYPADTRIKEAKAALKCLCDIRDDHIILLGYGDSYFNAKHTHYFYAEKEPAVTASGHSETYGADGINDYRYTKDHVHSPYTKTAYIKDLAEVISDIEPELLICSDLDEHPDHRMLSLCFDEAMGMILSQRTDYHPIVWKGFAYCNAYMAVNDFYGDRLKETVRPKIGKTEKYLYDITDTSVYQWDKRIQIRVSPEFSQRSLMKNVKAKALSRHKSQYVILRAGRIINADEVFWQRRTDSVSYQATVTATSGNAGALKDFHLLNCEEIDSEIPEFIDYLWSPENDRKEAVFSWNTPQQISCCRLYGNIAPDGRVKRVILSFDNGFEVSAGPLPERGKPLQIEFETQKDIRSAKIRIIEYEGTGWGIAECEFYGDQTQKDSESLIRSISSTEQVSPEKCMICTKTINKLYLNCVKVKKLASRIIRFARYKGIKGLLKKIMK